MLYQDTDHRLLPPAVCVRALDVTVAQSSIQVARGQAAVLPCSFTTSAALNNLNIIWMVTPLSNANQPEQVEWLSPAHPLTHSDSASLHALEFLKSVCLSLTVMRVLLESRQR